MCGEWAGAGLGVGGDRAGVGGACAGVGGAGAGSGRCRGGQWAGSGRGMGWVGPGGSRRGAPGLLWQGCRSGRAVSASGPGLSSASPVSPHRSPRPVRPVPDFSTHSPPLASPVPNPSPQALIHPFPVLDQSIPCPKTDSLVPGWLVPSPTPIFLVPDQSIPSLKPVSLIPYWFLSSPIRFCLQSQISPSLEPYQSPISQIPFNQSLQSQISFPSLSPCIFSSHSSPDPDWSLSSYRPVCPVPDHSISSLRSVSPVLDQSPQFQTRPS